jgi:predicted DNA-binding transcriptional regulator YafY
MAPSCHHFSVNRTERLYAITEELRAAGPAGRTASWLARRFEVSTRTVKRDVSALQQSGSPIWAQPGPHGGYVVSERVSLPPLSFNAAEAVAVALALQQSPGLPFTGDGRSALTKVLASMAPEERARVGDLAGRLWLRRDEDTGRAKVAAVLDEAVRRCVVTRIDYEDRSGAATRRHVEPAALAQTRGQWFLLAYCRLRQGPRWFRVDRIRSVHLSNEPAPRHDPATDFGTPPEDAHPVSV